MTDEDLVFDLIRASFTRYNIFLQRRGAGLSVTGSWYAIRRLPPQQETSVTFRRIEFGDATALGVVAELDRQDEWLGDVRYLGNAELLVWTKGRRAVDEFIVSVADPDFMKQIVSKLNIDEH